MKYKVVRRDARNYEVTDMSIAPAFGNYRPSVGVWVDEANGTRCCECSSMTVAMLANCAHCRAVKQLLKKQARLNSNDHRYQMTEVNTVLHPDSTIACTWCGKTIRCDAVIVFERSDNPYCSEDCADADNNSGEGDRV